jgi:hypothetical protein
VKKVWEIWKYSLGSFSDDKTAPYDNYVAGIRTLIVVSYMVTNVAIVANAVRHWDDVKTVPPVAECSETLL